MESQPLKAGLKMLATGCRREGCLAGIMLRTHGGPPFGLCSGAGSEGAPFQGYSLLLFHRRFLEQPEATETRDALLEFGDAISHVAQSLQE